MTAVLRRVVLILLMVGVMVGSKVMAEEPDPEGVKNLEPYPAAVEGKSRFAILLPHKKRGEEDAFRVELIVGKTMETDGVNTHRMHGKIEGRTLQGWGFSFYEVEKLGPVSGTLIGVPPGTPKANEFVSMEPKMIRYNSRLPIVVYVPEGAEVRYRIWTAGKPMPAKEG